MITDALSFKEIFLLIVRIVGVLIMLLGVIPRTIAEFNYKNAKNLPKILFFLMTFYTFAQACTVYVSWCRIAACQTNDQITTLAYIGAFGGLASAIAWLIIYRQKY